MVNGISRGWFHDYLMLNKKRENCAFFFHVHKTPINKTKAANFFLYFLLFPHII